DQGRNELFVLRQRRRSDRRTAERRERDSDVSSNHRLSSVDGPDQPVPGRERPRSRRTAEKRYEFPPFHSITSSAIASRPEGMARSKALAVCRLMTNSNLAACSTGRFFSPLRTRPT